MLSIGKLGAASEEYYLAVVASGVEDYYLAEGEARGRWLSDGGLGVAGEGLTVPASPGGPEKRAT